MGLYKNTYYDDFDSLEKLLENVRFLNLTMEEWRELLILKNTSVNFIELYQVLQEKILYYNTDSFLYKDNSYWFNKEMRSSLKTLADSNPETITLVLGSNFVELPTDKVKLFLSDLEIYAANCYVARHKHLESIKQLRTTEEVIKYDFTLNYPEKIILHD